MMVTKDDILQQLYRVKNSQRDYMSPQSYQNFLPLTLDLNRGTNPTRFQDNMQSILDESQAANAISATKAQNKKDFEAMLQSQKAVARAQAALSAANKLQNPVNTIHQQINDYGPSNGKVKSGPARNVGVNQNLGHYSWRGRGLTLNRSVAGRFLNFLNALSGEGYKINSIGSWRSHVGTNASGLTHDLHQMGMAIDINPGQNPFRADNQLITNLPPNVAQLAARYGLLWGGTWKHSKDTMHFSVPYGGIE